MKNKGLCLLVALLMSGVGAAHAQGFDGADDNQVLDDRWYIVPTIGGMYNDTSRDTNSRQAYWSIGAGKFISPKVAVEGFIDNTQRDRDPGYSGRHWTSTGLGMAARFYPGNFDKWRPYIMTGLLASRHESSPGLRGWSPAGQLGIGTQVGMTESTDFRMELAYRRDFDSETIEKHESYGDYIFGLSLVTRFGEPPAPPAAPVAPPPAPVVPDCSELDDDGDGVNNCDDRCPDTVAGTIVGPDGCPLPVVIDLRGVNFKFDRPKPGETDIAPTLQEPTEDSVAILDQAIDTLQRYPAVKVELDGHTDSTGPEAYNQTLSERRAQIVYEYLTSHGIDASRITDVKGFGESQPIDSNTTKDGRARNRRTELSVQNPEQPIAPGDSPD